MPTVRRKTVICPHLYNFTFQEDTLRAKFISNKVNVCTEL